MKELKGITIFILILQNIFINLISAQESKPAITDYIKISGYVKNDFYYDTRQTIAAREGLFLLYPAEE
jgi:hypothetical protein